MARPWRLIELLDAKRLLISLALQTGLFDVALGRLYGFGKGRRFAGEIRMGPASAGFPPWRSFRLTLSVPPIVERVELSVNGRTALLSCLFEISNGPYHVRVAHVPRRVIVLVHGEDAGVPLVQVVKCLEVGRESLRPTFESHCHISHGRRQGKAVA